LLGSIGADVKQGLGVYGQVAGLVEGDGQPATSSQPAHGAAPAAASSSSMLLLVVGAALLLLL
jgi:hypothetical protein